MKYKVVKYHHKSQEEWDAFIGNSANGTFLHQRNYMDYHADRFNDFSLLIYKEDKLVAVLPAHSLGKEIFSHNGLTYGDVIYAKKLRTAYKIKILQALFSFLQQNDIEYLHIKTLPTIFAQEPQEINHYLYGQMQAEIVKVKPFFVYEVSSGLQLNSDRKKHIKKLQKSDFVLSDNQKYLPDFWQIVEQNLQLRHQSKPVHSLPEIELLMERFSSKIKLFSLLDNNVVVAGALVFYINNTIHFQYIHATTDKQKRQGVDMLIYKILTNLEKHIKYVSLGSSEKGEGKLDAGLVYWKESFGTRVNNQTIYKIAVDNVAMLNHILL